MRFFIVSCSLTALVCIMVVSIEAKIELRQKRAVNREKCPENTTCEAWVEAQSKKECRRHDISGEEIIWTDCGRVMCGENQREVSSDLSKPYPECCPRCEVIGNIDPTKQAASLNQLSKVLGPKK